MKYARVLSWFLILMPLLGAKKKDSVDYIKVWRIPFELESPARIECSDFATTLTPYPIQTFIVKDKAHINMILENIKKSRDINDNGIDTRAQMFIIFKSGRIDTLCFSYTGVFCKGSKVKLLKDRTLVNYLDSLPYKRKIIEE